MPTCLHGGFFSFYFEAWRVCVELHTNWGRAANAEPEECQNAGENRGLKLWAAAWGYLLARLTLAAGVSFYRLPRFIPRFRAG